MGEVVALNTYDKKDRVKRLGLIRAGALKVAAYQVRDPETNEWSKIQFHMTYENCVMAVMEEESAKLFANFVGMTLPNPPENVATTAKVAA